MNYLLPPPQDTQRLVAQALAEDLTPLGDLSSTVLPGDQIAVASWVARDAGVLAGTYCVEEVVRQLGDQLTLTWEYDEGDPFQANTNLGSISGRLSDIVTAERVSLNFMSHLSGIATRVSAWVTVAADRVQVVDTRKTLPGYRSLQKAAVRAGGGRNHRGNLSDWIMLKDNHLVGVDIATAVRRANELWPGRVVEVETETTAQAITALEAGADIIMLDNFKPEEIKSAAVELTEVAKDKGITRPLIEASGGITLELLDEVAQADIDIVSSSSLTAGANPVDIGLDIRLSS